MSKPFFSVVIPTYNRAKLIAKTVDSILTQNFNDFELLVVDDGSTDDTDKIINSIKDPRLTYFKKKNEERAVARNYGARYAKGRYVNFFDSDDIAYSNHLASAYSFIRENSNPEIFHLSYDIRNENRQIVRKAPKVKDINARIVGGNFLSCNGVFVRHDVIIKNRFNEDRNLSSLEDWELWIRMASRYNFKYSPLVTSAVIYHNDRSVLSTDMEKIKTKEKLFTRYVFEDDKNIAAYGKKIYKASASVKTYTALHLAMAGATRKEIWTYLKDGIADCPGEILRRRFLVILRLIIGL